MSKYKNLTPDELFRVAEIDASTDLEKSLIESMTDIVSEAIQRSDDHFTDHYHGRECAIIDKINSAMGLDANDYDTDVFTQVRHLKSQHDEIESDLQKTSAALLVAQERANKAEAHFEKLKLKIENLRPDQSVHVELPPLVGALKELPDHIKLCVKSYGRACATVSATRIYGTSREGREFTQDSDVQPATKIAEVIEALEESYSEDSSLEFMRDAALILKSELYHKISVDEVKS